MPYEYTIEPGEWTTIDWDRDTGAWGRTLQDLHEAMRRQPRGPVVHNFARADELVFCDDYSHDGFYWSDAHRVAAIADEELRAWDEFIAGLQSRNRRGGACGGERCAQKSDSPT